MKLIQEGMIFAFDSVFLFFFCSLKGDCYFGLNSFIYSW